MTGTFLQEQQLKEPPGNPWTFQERCVVCWRSGRKPDPILTWEGTAERIPARSPSWALFPFLKGHKVTNERVK